MIPVKDPKAYSPKHPHLRGYHLTGDSGESVSDEDAFVCRTGLSRAAKQYAHRIRMDTYQSTYVHLNGANSTATPLVRLLKHPYGKPLYSSTIFGKNNL